MQADWYFEAAGPGGTDSPRSVESYVEATTVAFSVTTLGGSLTSRPRRSYGFDFSPFQISSTLAILILDGLRADHIKNRRRTCTSAFDPTLFSLDY
jgi:hypothetical protein